jgi:peptidyl-prolyl cis-trans isomerase C
MNARFLYSVLLALTLAFPFTFAGAQGSAALATVNGTVIPQSRFDRAVASLTQRGVQDTPQARESIREELIAREVVQQEAVRLGLDKLPEFAAALEEQRRNLLIQAFMQDHLRRNPVPDAAVKAEYDRLAAAAAEKAEKKILTFEQAAPQLRAALEQQSVRQAAAELRKQATIQ